MNAAPAKPRKFTLALDETDIALVLLALEAKLQSCTDEPRSIAQLAKIVEDCATTDDISVLEYESLLAMPLHRRLLEIVLQAGVPVPETIAGCLTPTDDAEFERVLARARDYATRPFPAFTIGSEIRWDDELDLKAMRRDHKEAARLGLTSQEFHDRIDARMVGKAVAS